MSTETVMLIIFFAGVGLFVVVSIAAVFALRAATRRIVCKVSRREPVPGRIGNSVPPRARQVTRQLADLAKRRLPRSSRRFSDDVRAIVRHTQELFDRLARTGTEGQRQVAEVELIDQITKVRDAVTTYHDIVAHPQLWANAGNRMREIEQAVAATNRQLVEKIRQVNASGDLELRVKLERLSGKQSPS